ncbi:MAG: glycosyltransferase family 39 protein [Candidatus Aminicenantes bacterium]|nr:glycosyltransferase family 39 protein [Candidatus Aminicenantes bacterium]
MTTIQAGQPAVDRDWFSNFTSNTVCHFFLIFFVELIAYNNFFSGFFLSDDFNLLTGTSKWLTPAVEFFRPVPHLIIHSFHKLFGMNVFPYHLLSFLIHYLNAILVYLLLKKLAAGNYFALTGGVLFAANFLISEAVFWISAITSLLVTLFYLLTLYFFINYLAKLNKKYCVPAVICMIFALLTKENAVTLPVVLFFAAFYIENGQVEKNRLLFSLKRVLPFLFVTFAFLLVKAGSLTAAVSENTLSLGYHNLRNARHLVLSLFTFNPFYDLPFIYIDVKILNLFPGLALPAPALPINIKFVASLIIGTIILIFSIYIFFKGNKRMKAAFLAFFISMGPFIFVSSHHLRFGGHFLYPLRLYYLPAAFFFIFFALLLQGGYSRLKKRVKSRRPVILLVVLLIGVLTLSDLLKVNKRSRDWLIAGNITRSVINGLADFIPSGPEERKMVLFNLPDSYKGVYILRNGLRSALTSAYPDSRVTIEIVKIPPEDYEFPTGSSYKKNLVFINCAEAELTPIRPEEFKKIP